MNQTHLGLNVGNLARGKLVLIGGDLGVLEVCQKFELLWEQKQEGFPSSRNSSNSVDVFLGLIWRIELDDPIHGGDVQPSRCDVRTEEDPGLRIFELEKGRGSLLLLLFTLRSVMTVETLTWRSSTGISM